MLRYLLVDVLVLIYTVAGGRVASITLSNLY